MRKIVSSVIVGLLIIFSLIPFLGRKVYAATNPYGKYQDVDGDGYQEVRCTWYAWQKAYDVCGVVLPGWGNAKTWLASAQNAGYATGSEPHINSIAVFNTGTYGHVSFVTAVNGDKMTVVEGGNTSLDNTSSQGVGTSYPSSVVGVGGLIGFIYLDPSQLYANLGEDFYAVILSLKHWKPISLNVETHLVTLETEKGVAYQKWHFQRQSDGSYVISSCDDGKVLEMTNGERTNGTQLSATWTDWGGAYQRWFLYQQGDGYIFKSKHFSDEEWVMNLYNNSSSSGTKIDIQNKNGSDAQIFSVYKGNDIQLTGPTLSYSESDGKAAFTWSRSYGAKQYDLKIWKNKIWEGDAYYTGQAVSSGITVELEPGTYQAYVDAVDFFQYQMGNVVEFTINKPQHQHSWNTDYTIDKAATCTQTGSKSIHCSTCGAIKDGSEQIIPMINHSYGSWIVTKEATIDEEGLKERVCTICGNRVTETIPKVVPTDGWIKNSSGTWFYFTNGVKTTGWKQVSGKWYLFDNSGAMLTGWQKVNGTWYYMSSSGAMATGWVKDGNTWYYMNSSGAMVTGWQKVNGTWYFFKSSGAMAENEWVQGYYWISASGAWTYQPVGSWKKDNVGWWFGDTSGWYAKNTTQMIDGILYTFNAAGYWVG